MRPETKCALTGLVMIVAIWAGLAFLLYLVYKLGALK